MEEAKYFIFVDERGDPGNVIDSSDYYQLNIVLTNKIGIQNINKEISRFRYFLDFGKELKEYWSRDKLKAKIVDIVENILIHNEENIYTFIFYVDKDKYKGPHLGKSGTKFRDYLLIKALEYIFKNNKYVSLERLESIELVIDRYLENEKEQRNLADFIRNNYKLPRSKDGVSKIAHIVHIQSLYSDALQVSDIVGRYFSEIIKTKKGPVALRGPKPFSSIYKL